MRKAANVKKYISILFLWVNVFSFMMYLFERRKVNSDLERLEYRLPFKRIGILSLNYALLFMKTFRAVFQYRTAGKHPALKLISWLTLPAPSCIEIAGEIGDGFMIFHNMGCVIYPYKAGKNLSVGHGVTIGRSDKPNEDGIDSPIIGDNVHISTNAIVFGPIHIGNNVIIGAGTVLNKSVPDNCTVVGNPARIVKRDGVKCNQPL